MRFVLFTLLLLTSLSRAAGADPAILEPAFYSFEGRERAVTFEGVFRSDLRSFAELEALTADEKMSFAAKNIEPTLKFLFGPLVNRNLGSPQRGTTVEVNWDSPALDRGRVSLKYTYRAVWIVDKNAPEAFKIPVPLNQGLLKTPAWKKCTDSDPEHQNDWYYWYFWDPARAGCDQKAGVQYAEVTAQLGAETPKTATTYPEYDKLLKSTGRDGLFRLTFGFGYVEDQANPDPDRDDDAGVFEYRQFVKQVRATLPDFTDTPIRQNEYPGNRDLRKVIGHRFAGKLHGADVVINVVANAGVDQMQIFAKSFAHDHDGFFGWFGHSRVGSGFDAQQFANIVAASPDFYSVTPAYQLVYWGGCNSYSYYTLPFFEFKARVSGGADPRGTKGLDIIANGLPSYFSLNGDNAAILLKNLLAWDQRPSYQSIVDELEARANGMGARVLVAVLGDEDNE